MCHSQLGGYQGKHERPKRCHSQKQEHDYFTVSLTSICYVKEFIYRCFSNENRSSTSPVSTESLEILALASPRFVRSLSGLVTNLVMVSPENVLDKVKDEDILGHFVG